MTLNEFITYTNTKLEELARRFDEKRKRGKDCKHETDCASDIKAIADAAQSAQATAQQQADIIEYGEKYIEECL